MLTPLAIDPGHPFPHLANRSLCLVASIRPVTSSLLPHASLAVVHIPGLVVPRFVALPAAPGQYAFVLLEDVIRLHLPLLYNGYEVISCHAIRVTRDAEFEVKRGRADDLLTSIEAGLRERRMGDAVRLQCEAGLPEEVRAALVDELELSAEDLYHGEGFTAFSDLFQLYAAVNLPRLKDQPLPPHPVPGFESAPDVWSAIRAGDILAHHPYQSFDAVTRFVSEAARDPKVLAIKMTLYRVSPTSPIAQALTVAAENGKEVAVLVELRARFDEEANIHWARALEEVGAHVVYGIAGFKTHCKACLVVRQEADGMRRYCHLATGNYNIRTSGVYGDLGLFTAHDEIGADVTELFNMLTGYTRPRALRHLIVAPAGLRDGLVARIRREAEHARARGAGRIVAKMNSLADRALIDELYRASQAGVRIDLIVRGICCLRPGVPRAFRRHPGDLDRGPVSRARPRVRLRQCRRARIPARLIRLDAAQPRLSRRDRLPHPRSPAPAPHPRHPRHAACGHGEGPAHPPRRPLEPRDARRRAPLRSQERLYAWPGRRGSSSLPIPSGCPRAEPRPGFTAASAAPRASSSDRPRPRSACASTWSMNRTSSGAWPISSRKNRGPYSRSSATSTSNPRLTSPSRIARSSNARPSVRRARTK